MRGGCGSDPGGGLHNRRAGSGGLRGWGLAPHIAALHTSNDNAVTVKYSNTSPKEVKCRNIAGKLCGVHDICCQGCDVTQTAAVGGIPCLHGVRVQVHTEGVNIDTFSMDFNPHCVKAGDASNSSCLCDFTLLADFKNGTLQQVMLVSCKQASRHRVRWQGGTGQRGQATAR